MSAPTHLSSPPSKSESFWTRDLLLLGLVFAALYLFMLGSYPLANPDEGRYAEIPREMLSSGDWVLPRLNDVFYFEKPPLVYWTTAIALLVGGQNEWAARCVPVFYALLGLFVTYAAARRFFGRQAALASAVILGTSLFYFALARILILDMAVSVLISATLFCFILGVEEPAGPRRRWLMLGLYASAALATLAKGLIGVLLPGAVMFLWLLVFNQWKRLRPLHLPLGGLLFLAIAAPWHLLAAERHEQWAWFYFVHEQYLRFTTTTHDRYEPWWFFGPIVLLGLFPWTGHLWSAIKSALPGSWARRSEHRVGWFLVLWVVFIVLFFSRSQSKLAPYVLPVFPPLAVLLGAWMSKLSSDRKVQSLRLGTWLAGIVLLLLGLALLVLFLFPGLVRDAQPFRQASPWLLGGGLGLVILSLLSLGSLKSGSPVRVFVLQALGAAMLYSTLVGAYPHFHKRSSKEPAQAFAALVQPGDQVFHYRGFAHDFVFYSKHPVGLVDHVDELGLSLDSEARASGRFIAEEELLKLWSGEGRIWVMGRKSELEKLTAHPGFKYHLIASNLRYSLLSNRP